MRCATGSGRRPRDPIVQRRNSDFQSRAHDEDLRRIGGSALAEGIHQERLQSIGLGWRGRDSEIDSDELDRAFSSGDLFDHDHRLVPIEAGSQIGQVLFFGGVF